MTVVAPGEPGGGDDVMRWLLGGHTGQWIEAIDAWTIWLTAAGARSRTIQLRRYQLGHLAESFLDRGPWSLSIDDLIGWQAGQSWAPATRASYRSALRSFYGWGHRSGHIKRDPTLDLPRVRTMCGPPRPTPDQVLATALEHASAKGRLVLLLAAYAGLRRVEIAALRWDQVGEDRIRVDGKGGKIRNVPVHPLLVDELTRYQRTDHSEWVFPGRTSGHMHPDAVGRLASRLLGPGWSGHTLRARFATRCYRGTHDLLAVQALLGHADPTTTKRYTQLADDTLAAAVRSV